MLSQEKKLINKRAKLFNELSSYSFFIKGSLIKGTKKCGRKGCKCQSGELHPHNVISTFKNNKTHITYIPLSFLEQAENAIDNYSKVKDIIERISQINIELLKSGKR
jgi:hypothetical protein